MRFFILFSSLCFNWQHWGDGVSRAKDKLWCISIALMIPSYRYFPLRFQINNRANPQNEHNTKKSISVTINYLKLFTLHLLCVCRRRQWQQFHWICLSRCFSPNEIHNCRPCFIDEIIFLLLFIKRDRIPRFAFISNCSYLFIFLLP